MNPANDNTNTSFDPLDDDLSSSLSHLFDGIDSLQEDELMYDDDLSDVIQQPSPVTIAPSTTSANLAPAATSQHEDLRVMMERALDLTEIELPR
ncbi:hypothetical protein [Absidia glauca]|uniref:Uncharacterized protein n=1 Tax=Absidia glauca TaxID=4829 RepID=A0A163K5D4_ABSGL|nr:hypothetical protein [Absidia glauca]